jgi:hypothetical protein
VVLAIGFYSLRTSTRGAAAVILAYEGYRLSVLELEVGEGARGGDTKEGDTKGRVS